MQPFELLDYEAPSRLDRVVGVEPKRNAYVELHNLIAAAESLAEFGPDDLLRISRSHGTDLRVEFFKERRGVYAALLSHFLHSGEVAASQREALAHLARSFYLAPADLEPVHEKAFGRLVGDVLSDDCLSIDERLLLYTFQHTLGVRLELEGAYDAAASERLLGAVARALCDDVLSAEEAETIRALEQELHVKVPEGVERRLDRAAHRWKLLQGPLPTVNVGIRLLPGETGHFVTLARWRNVNYARLRILLDDHRALLHRGDTHQLHIPDAALEGRKWWDAQIVITNKRLLVHREQKMEVYTLQSLNGAERYANGVRVSVKGARSFVMDASLSTDLLYTVLWRALHPGRKMPRH